MPLRISSLLVLSGLGLACAPAPPGSAAGAPPATSAPTAQGSTEPALATASAAPSAGGITLFVAETLADCQGEGPMKCMRIRTADDQPWSLHYDRIEGFTYEPSFAYELLVEKRDVPQPRADAPSFRYRLLRIVSKRKVEPAP